MSFLNLFTNLKRAADAKAQKKADQIEEENLVEFSKQDITTMENDLRTANSNIGSTKGEIAVLKDKIKDLRDRIKKYDEDAIALSEAGKEDLALQNSNMAGTLEPQAEVLEQALKTQETVLQGHIQTRNQISAALEESKANLTTIKAMTDAAKANEKLTSISSGASTNALNSFKERQEAAKKRLIKSQAIKDENNAGGSLQTATDEALGRSSGADRLARLKNSQKTA